MKSPVEQLQQELVDQKKLYEIVAREALLNLRVVKLLVAAGFVTEGKIKEARALLRPLT